MCWLVNRILYKADETQYCYSLESLEDIRAQPSLVLSYRQSCANGGVVGAPYH